MKLTACTGGGLSRLPRKGKYANRCVIVAKNLVSRHKERTIVHIYYIKHRTEQRKVAHI